jgi:hypothetical protein
MWWMTQLYTVVECHRSECGGWVRGVGGSAGNAVYIQNCPDDKDEVVIAPKDEVVIGNPESWKGENLEHTH